MWRRGSREVGSTTCTPFERWSSGGAVPSSRRRIASTQGPAAFTTQRARTRICAPGERAARHHARRARALDEDLLDRRRDSPSRRCAGARPAGWRAPGARRRSGTRGRGTAWGSARVAAAVRARRARRRSSCGGGRPRRRAELLVGRESGAELEQARPGARGHQHPARLGEVGRQRVHALALERGLADQRDVAHRRGSGARRGSAWRSGSRCRPRSRRASSNATEGRAARPRARCPRP